MRWVVMGLLALNVLQGIYIFSYGGNDHGVISQKIMNSAPISLTATTKTNNTDLAISGPSTPHHDSQALTNHDSTGIAVVSQEVRVVSRSLVNKLVESGKGLNTVRFALWPKGGFLATYVKQASMISHLGLMKGDVVKSINDTQMSSVLHALSIYQDLEELQFLELGIERQGKAISYFYKLID